MKILVDIKDIDLFEIQEVLNKKGVKLYDITTLTKTFAEYMKSVFERRDFVSDRDIQFLFTDEQINRNIDHFQDAWENGLSPYKALTFLTLNNEL
jgi:hypothetical protein